MLRAVGLAFADLANRRVLTTMLQAMTLSLLLFLGLGGALFWLLLGADVCSLEGGSCPLSIGGSVAGAFVIMLLAAWFLFPAVTLAVIMTFADRIGRAIEEQHYPAAARAAQPIGILGGLSMGLRSAGRLILFNLLAAPFYVILLVTGIGPFILFVIVNGLAFGRDLGELAAARHGDSNARRDWLRSTRGEQHLIGTLVSALFLVPFANLIAPVIGVAAGIHLFNRSFWATNGAPDSSTPAAARSNVSGGR